jgi:sugar phosphate isomerase/epimerase
LNVRKNLRRQVGISTLSLRGVTLEKAIHLMRGAGFSVFELVPHIYGGPEGFGRFRWKEIAKRLECFEFVTVHTSGPKLEGETSVDIASPDPVHRRRSIDHYLACIDLALDIGARVITFHPAPVDKQAMSCQKRDAYLEFASEALSAVGDLHVRLGYEFFDADLAKHIGDPRFGLLFDVGHAAMLFDDEATAGILGLMDNALPVTVEFHLHGVEQSASGDKTDHLPFDRCNAIDYRRILRSIRGSGFDGPLVFEIGIFNLNQAVRNLRDCQEALEECAAIW